MNIPDWIDTTNVETNFVVANTPNFIVRRIREDKAPHLLSQNFSAEQLLKMYVEASAKKPDNLRELVTPYLLLSALWLKTDIKYLRDAIVFSPHPQYKWLRAFAQILIDTFRATTVVRVGPHVLDNSVFVKSGSAVNYTSIDLSRQ
jgi:hypothetical protein